MGRAAPKSAEIIGGLEDVVKDAILTDNFDDPVLTRLIEITLASITEKRPLFPSILDEPEFYRSHFRRWVEEGMQERVKEREAHEEDH